MLALTFPCRRIRGNKGALPFGQVPTGGPLVRRVTRRPTPADPGI